MNDIFEKLVNLPTTITAYTILDRAGDFTVFINSKMTRERQEEACQHELEHIRNGDFDRTGSADLIEIYAHELSEGGKKT